MVLSSIGLFLVFGSVVGGLAGMLGIGGGLFYVPLLIWYLERQQVDSSLIPYVAVSTSLSIIFVSILNSSFTHWKRGNLRLNALPFLVSGGAVGALLSSLLLLQVRLDEYKCYFAIFLLLVGIKLILSTKENDSITSDGISTKRIALVTIGFTAGCVSSFFGVGGGLIIVSLLYLFLGFEMKHAVGTSSGFMIPICFFSLLSYYFQSNTALALPEEVIGSVFLPAFLAITPTAFIFSRFGAIVADRINGERLQLLFGLLITGVALSKLIDSVF